MVSCGLLARAREAGATTSGLKPIAAGASLTPEGLQNEDALALAEVSTVRLPYASRNPLCLESPIAPHVALSQRGQMCSVQQLLEALGPALAEPADLTLIEGAGGWLVPLNTRETLADFACALNAPVILVVGMRLGCLNHAALTAASIRAKGAQLAGWVANIIDPEMAALQASLETLIDSLETPCLGVVPYTQTPKATDIARALPDLSQGLP